MAARRYMEEFGTRIAENGYEVIPIIPGEKRPAGEKWQKFDGSPEGVQDYLADGKGGHGVGIKSRYAPGVDIDILDEAVNAEVQDIVREIAGESPLKRVGLPPKVLWVYRAEKDETFPKVDTGEWLDPQGRKAKLEILADGQQFVAAHIHPDTGKPYQWLDGKSVLSVKRKDLPVLTHEQAKEIKERVLQVFLGHGWTKKTRNSITRLTNPLDDDDPFSAYRPKVQIGDEELERKLFLIEDNTDHDTWFQIGMALYHQYDGSQQGFDLWDRWSASAPNYDREALEKRWPTFNNRDKAHIPITCRIVLKLAKDAEEQSIKEKVVDFLSRLQAAPDTDSLVAVCDEIKVVELPNHVRELMTGKVKAKWKDLTGEAPRIGFVRELIRFESKEIISAPPWVKPWVYCSQTDNLFNIVNRMELTRPAFNAAFSRFMLTPTERLEGKAAPEILPTDAVLNLYQVPTVYNRMFMPGQPALYSIDGVDYANSYTEDGIPELPGELSPVEEEAIQIFLDHLVHIIANERDRTIFLDFMTYIVQHPGQRINWAILLQGAEGDGKSFFISVLKAVLGDKNVNMIPGKALEEKYNPWAENALVCFIEDVRLHGNNRFDAINTLKPMITNPTVSIRRMNTNPYEVVNTMNYITTSNLKDAMPVGDEDSRIFPIFTRFQRASDLEKFKQNNPTYYDRLYAIIQFAGALRQFFLLRKLSADFNPKARAPKSSYRREMVLLNQTEEVTALADTLEESEQDDYSEFLLDSSKVADHFMGTDALAPRGKALSRLLSQYGFTLLGRFKVNGEKRQYWTMQPWAWPEDDLKRGDAVREYLDPDGL
mgnify:CR=1 FL=1